jgi:hypothetical protein
MFRSNLMPRSLVFFVSIYQPKHCRVPLEHRLRIYWTGNRNTTGYNNRKFENRTTLVMVLQNAKCWHGGQSTTSCRLGFSLNKWWPIEVIHLKLCTDVFTCCNLPVWETLWCDFLRLGLIWLMLMLEKINLPNTCHAPVMHANDYFSCHRRVGV